MQVVVVAFLYSKVTMLKPMASGTASTNDSSQMSTISTTVTAGIPVPCTRDQDATARYLGSEVIVVTLWLSAHLQIVHRGREYRALVAWQNLALV